MVNYDIDLDMDFFLVYVDDNCLIIKGIHLINMVVIMEDILVNYNRVVVIINNYHMEDFNSLDMLKMVINKEGMAWFIKDMINN